MSGSVSSQNSGLSSPVKKTQKSELKRARLGVQHAAMLQMNMQVMDEKERLTVFGKELIMPQNMKYYSRENVEGSPMFVEKLDKLAVRMDQHLQSPTELSRRYATDLDKGLSEGEAGERLKKRGPNEIRTSAARSRVARLTHFVFASTNALTLLCMILLAVGYLLQDSKEESKLWTLLPLGLTMLGSSISSFLRETKSKRLGSFAREYLALTQHSVWVIREGVLKEVPARNLVAGDMCVLKGGDKVPADMRIVSGTVYVDEKLLTGVRGEVRKSMELMKNNLGSLEADNVLFLGTEVTSGRCTGLVFHCGNSSTIAKLGNQLHQYERHHSSLSEDLTFFHTLILGFASLLGILVGMISQWTVAASSRAASGSSARVEQAGSATVISVAGIILSSAPLLFNIVLVAGLGLCDTFGLERKHGVYLSQMDFINSLASVGAIALGSDSLLVDKSSRQVTFCSADDLETLARIFNLTRSSLDDPTVDSVIISYFKSRGVRILSPAPSDDNVAVDPVSHCVTVKQGSLEYVRGPAASLVVGGEDGARIRSLQAEGDTVMGFVEKKCEEEVVTRVIGFVSVSNPISLKTVKSVEFLTKMGIRIIPLFHSPVPHSIVTRAGILRGEDETAEKSCQENFDEIFHDPHSSSFIFSSEFPETAASQIDHQREAVEEGSLMEGRQLALVREDKLTNLLSTTAAGFVNVSFIQKLRVVIALKKSTNKTVAFIGGLDLDAPALRAAHLGIAASWGGLASRVSDVRVSRPDALIAIAEAIANCRNCVFNLRKVFMYMIAQVVPRMGPLLVSLAFAYPLSLSVELIVLGSLVIDLPVCLALLFEKPEYDMLTRPPRNEFKQPIISQRMTLLAISFLGILGALSGFLGFTQVLSDYGFNPKGLIGFGRASFVLFRNQNDDVFKQGLPPTLGAAIDLSLASLTNIHLCGRVGKPLSLTFDGLSQVPQTQRCHGPLFTLDMYNQYCYSLNSNLTYATSSQAIVSLFTQQKALASVLFARDPTALGTPLCGSPNLDGVFVPHGFYTTSSQPIIDLAMQDYPCASGQTIGPVHGLPICFSNDALWYGQTVYFSSAAFFAILTSILILRTELFSFFHVGYVHGNWYLLAAAMTSFALLLLVIYAPFLNTWLGTRPLEVSNLFTSAMPFFILAFACEETRKYLMRMKTPAGRWLIKRTMW